MTTFYATVSLPREARLLACGHASQPSCYTQGFTVDPDTGKTLCFDCTAVAIRNRMAKLPVGEKVYDLILRGLVENQQTLTTWHGVLLTRIVSIVNRKLRGGKQVSFRFLLGDRVWAGRCNQYGGKVVCWPTKRKSLQEGLRA